jgi:hypothetical protein
MPCPKIIGFKKSQKPSIKFCSIKQCVAVGLPNGKSIGEVRAEFN